MSGRFSDHLRRVAAPVWEACFKHPFVRGIGDGSLDLDRFRHWVRQDYLFLIEYCRLFALAAARSPDLDTLTRFADLLQATVRTEMDLHRRCAAELGISGAELEAESMGATTRGYTDFLVRTAALGDFPVVCAALLPCLWGYSETGRRLGEGDRPRDPQLAAWIDSYASREFAELAAWCRALVDGLAEGANEATRDRMERAFVTSSRYELAFWEMAWRMEG